MPNGGKLIIRTDKGPSPPVPNGVVNTAASYIVLTVGDNGCGMDADTQSHIFEPFFTTKDQGKGTGLGLSTVFGIVKQSSGHISVQSEVGQGTTFSIHLPCVEEEGIQAEEAVPSGVAVAGTETILIVEDEEAVRKSAAEFLAENGYKVLEAAEGSEALKIAEQYSQPIHLLLTDVIMPGMSGRELSERITPIHPETKVLFMSGYSNNLLSERQILDSRFVLLQKPFLLTGLGRSIREILDNDQSQAAFA
jgi:CheY-like chemotaxis protein